MSAILAGILRNDNQRVTVNDVGAGTAAGKFVGGFRVSDTGVLQVTTAAVADANFRGGLAMRDDGALFVTTSAPATVRMNSGLQCNDSGVVFIAFAARNHTSSGWPIASTGALAVTT